MRLSYLAFIVSTLAISVSATAKRTNSYEPRRDAPTRLDGRPVADSPLVRMAQGDAGASDHLTHRPIAINPQANHRLIFAVAFEKEAEAIWAFQHGATATDAIAICQARKEETEKNYGVGICEKVEARFTSLRNHETNFRNLMRFAIGAGVVVTAVALSGVIFCGRCIINKLKTA